MHLSLSGEGRNPLGSVADLDMLIGVGFGVACIYKDKELIYDENHNDDESDYKELSFFEEMACKDPNHSWRCVLEAPLSDATWERQDTGKWVCIKSGMGFA